MHVALYGKEVVCVPGDGMCFLKSIQICLQRDFNEHYTLTELKDKIVDELVEHGSLARGNKCNLGFQTLQ